MNVEQQLPIKVIIGLGNPGRKYQKNRHNFGFLVLDALATAYGVAWRSSGDKDLAEIFVGDRKIVLVKPQTFMNSSGNVVPGLLKNGLSAENLLVVHDELEKEFGVVDVKVGGSHRGHNGLRSIISACGAQFYRLRLGIGRPVHKEDVPDYVLTNFTESSSDVGQVIERAITSIKELIVA